MGALKPYVIGLILLTLFSLAAFIFMEGFLIQNNATSHVLDNADLNSTTSRLNNSLASFADNARDMQELLDKDEPSTTSFVFLIFKSAFSIPKAFLSIVTAGISLFTSTIYKQLFGTSPAFFIIFAVINAITIITIVLYIIKAVRTGESER